MAFVQWKQSNKGARTRLTNSSRLAGTANDEIDDAAKHETGNGGKGALKCTRQRVCECGSRRGSVGGVRSEERAAPDVTKHATRRGERASRRGYSSREFGRNAAKRPIIGVLGAGRPHAYESVCFPTSESPASAGSNSVRAARIEHMS